MVGRGERSLHSDPPGRELRLGGEKEKEECKYNRRDERKDKTNGYSMLVDYRLSSPIRRKMFSPKSGTVSLPCLLTQLKPGLRDQRHDRCDAYPPCPSVRSSPNGITSCTSLYRCSPDTKRITNIQAAHVGSTGRCCNHIAFFFPLSSLKGGKDCT